MTDQPSLQPLLHITDQLLTLAIAERETFYEGVRLPNGTIPDPGDQAALDHVDDVINEAQATLLAYRSLARPYVFTTHRPRRAPLWARLAKRWRMTIARRRFNPNLPIEWSPRA